MNSRLRAPERRLTLDEERELVRRIGAGDYDARNDLILAHVWIVAQCVRHFADRGLDSEDLAGEGLMGLIDAAEKFSAGRGEARFKTWAFYSVRGAMSRGIANYGKLIRKGVDAERRARKAWRVRDKLRRELQREPTWDEMIAGLGGLSHDRAESLRAALTTHHDALSDIPPEDREQLLARIAVADEPVGDEATDGEAGLSRAEMLRRLEPALAKLEQARPRVGRFTDRAGRRWGRSNGCFSAGWLAAAVDNLDHLRLTRPDVCRQAIEAIEFLREAVRQPK